MGTISYLDFDLLVHRSEGGYTARVLTSPGGQASVTFTLPFQQLELENVLLRLSRTRRGVRKLESPEMQTARDFGGRLFDAVFSQEVGSALRTSLREADVAGRGLRMRLRLSGAPELLDLPWEYLYDASFNRFLVLSTETPVVRYLELPNVGAPLRVEPPLRLLFMVSSPTNYAQLDTKREWERLHDALADLERRNLVTLSRLERGTLTHLQRSLRQQQYHIFHFLGHGAYDKQVQDSVLLFEDEDGLGQPMPGRFLGTLLHDQRSLRLALLNACEGARTDINDPFAGTAQSLVQQGIPAVIAMQFEITDAAAITLAHEFYGALADGYPVDAALAEARKALFAGGNDVEWGTPVLYLSAPDGHIFDIVPSSAATPAVERPHRETEEADPELEQRLSRLYTAGLSAFWLDDWERARRNFQAVIDLRPAYRDARARLETAQANARLAKAYAQAVTAQSEGNWALAVETLEALVREAPGYKDAGRMLANAQHQQQLAELYAEARQLAEAGQWQAVLNVFQQISGLAADYPDPDRLVERGRAAVAEQELQARLEGLYAAAVQEIDDGRLERARDLLAQVHQLQPGFQDTEPLLAHVISTLRLEAEKRESSEQAQALYHQAAELVAAGQWRTALARLAAARQADPGLDDQANLAQQAQAGMAAEEEQGRRQAALDAVYGEAVTLLETGQLEAAQARWEDLQKLDPAYPDKRRVAERVRQGLDERRTRVEPANQGTADRPLPSPEMDEASRQHEVEAHVATANQAAARPADGSSKSKTVVIGQAGVHGAPAPGVPTGSSVDEQRGSGALSRSRAGTGIRLLATAVLWALVSGLRESLVLRTTTYHADASSYSAYPQKMWPFWYFLVLLLGGLALAGLMMSYLHRQGLITRSGIAPLAAGWTLTGVLATNSLTPSQLMPAGWLVIFSGLPAGLAMAYVLRRELGPAFNSTAAWLMVGMWTIISVGSMLVSAILLGSAGSFDPYRDTIPAFAHGFLYGGLAIGAGGWLTNVIVRPALRDDRPQNTP